MAVKAAVVAEAKEAAVAVKAAVAVAKAVVVAVVEGKVMVEDGPVEQESLLGVADPTRSLATVGIPPIPKYEL